MGAQLGMFLEGRGGPDRGQGRKKLNPMQKLVPVAVRLKPTLVRKLKKEDGNTTDVIREALEFYFANRDKVL